jgi:hypothetical protein
MLPLHYAGHLQLQPILNMALPRCQRFVIKRRQSLV